MFNSQKIVLPGNRRTGLLLTFLLSILILFVFYHKLVLNLNHVYFANSGDGLNTYYATYYHVQFDSTYAHFQGMNYPYGEHVMFTSGQPLLANGLKFLKSLGVPVSEYTVGIINFLMLASIPLGAIFLYLFFVGLELPVFASSLVAVGIAFLSPQIQRMGGHLSLTYVCVIPGIFYLLLRYLKSQNLKNNLLICLFVFVFAGTHLYFLIMLLFILSGFWIYYALIKKLLRDRKTLFPGLFFQILLPVLIIQLYGLLTDHITDRTSHPTGFLYYSSNWEGIFYPYNSPLGKWLSHTLTIIHPSWEGEAFAGHFSFFFFVITYSYFAFLVFLEKGMFFWILFLIISSVLAERYLRKRSLKNFRLSAHPLLNVFGWVALISLLFSFAYPFRLGLQNMIEYIGPVKQFRSLGRFSWIFFYTINTIGFYAICKSWFKKVWLKNVFLTLFICVLFYDAFKSNDKYQYSLANENSFLDESSPAKSVKQWTKNFTTENYQAIIPLPYFHIGSENISIQGKTSDMKKKAVEFSWRTGIPMTAVEMGRTSISQTYENVSLVLEPYRMISILNKFDSKKPFLILAMDDIPPYQEKILRKAKKISETGDYNLYEITFDSLRSVFSNISGKKLLEYKNSSRNMLNGFEVTNPNSKFYYNSFDDNGVEKTYQGNGAFKGDVLKFNSLYNDTVPSSNERDYFINLWIGDFKKDRVPKLVLELALFDSSAKLYNTMYCTVHDYLQIIDGDWAMLEIPFSVKSNSDLIQLTTWNREFYKSEPLFIDEFLIRPASDTIYKYNESENTLFMNGRFYNLKTENN